MLTATHEKRGDTLVIQLEGILDESSSLDQIVGPIQSKEIHFGCKGIRRLNSAGVRGWVIYFENLRKRGLQFRFFECTPTMVEQINLIRNFRMGAPIDSFYLPYVCTGCKGPFLQLVMTADLPKEDVQVPVLSCPKCKSPLSFDDLPEEYFLFLGFL